MTNTETMPSPVLIAGHGKLCWSVTASLLKAGFPVTLCTREKVQARLKTTRHIDDLKEWGGFDQIAYPQIVSELAGTMSFNTAIAITEENVEVKKQVIAWLEDQLSDQAIIAINTECIPLSTLQSGSKNPERIIGLNWTEPAHTTFFLEIISNNHTSPVLVNGLFNQAKIKWDKDPYIIAHDYSIRSRMIAALTREAFYLIENGYATVEDIDRACRNDAGYYLPFSGNYRYMDLMGTYAYGAVMKDLNRELSKAQNVPSLMVDLVNAGAKGMENNYGFYEYDEGDAQKWEHTFREFSFRIREVMEKFPFERHKNQPVTSASQKANSDE